MEECSTDARGATVADAVGSVSRTVPRARRAGPLLLLLCTVLTPPAEARAQERASSPEAVAERFFHGLGRLQWSRIVDLLHSDAQDRFRVVAEQLVGSLRGDSILILLYGGETRESFEDWTPRETFQRSMTGLVSYARGLMESQVTTDVAVIGTVAEGDSIRHVVYREGTDHMGTEIVQVAVTTLRLQDGRWRIWSNDELDVLEAAFRGVRSAGVRRRARIPSPFGRPPRLRSWPP